MAQALYSKYRPKTFDDVIGQKSILQTIKNSIKANKVSHAYMFCGPRGTGKTTMARLLAKSCMCQNCSDDAPIENFCGTCQNCVDIAKGMHPDVYELDAASRTGVENVRDEIISRVGFAATRGQKKIYIIDEVHMLSTAAFNALLKTLEEPPEHVIFILCTTNPEKVPDTILSRCQRFDFSAISNADIIERLKFVCEQEGVTADDLALDAIAQNCNGAMRNALTQLEQLIAFSDGNITINSINNVSAQNLDFDYGKLIEALGLRDLPATFNWIDSVCQKGADFTKIFEQLSQIVRDMYLASCGSKKNICSQEIIEQHLDLFTTERLHRIMVLLHDLGIQMKTSTNLRLAFELTMSKITNPRSDFTLEALAERIANLEIVATAGDLSPSFVVENIGSGQHEKPKPEHIKTDFKQDVSTEPMQDAEPEEPHKSEPDVIDPKSADLMSAEKTNPDIKFPQKNEPVDFGQEREKLKKQAYPESNDEDSAPGSASDSSKIDTSDIQKTWMKIFSNIRKKYPAFGATLLTADASFDNSTNQLVLKFPSKDSFSVGVLKKPDSMEKIHEEVKAIMGDEIGFNIEVDQSLDKNFSPEFVNNFRKEEDSQPQEAPAPQPTSSAKPFDVPQVPNVAPAPKIPDFSSSLQTNISSEKPNIAALPKVPEIPSIPEVPKAPDLPNIPAVNSSPAVNPAPSSTQTAPLDSAANKQDLTNNYHPSQDLNTITDILNDSGAYNITEE